MGSMQKHTDNDLINFSFRLSPPLTLSFQAAARWIRLLYYYHYYGNACAFILKKVIIIKGNKLSPWDLYLFTILHTRIEKEKDWRG